MKSFPLLTRAFPGLEMTRIQLCKDPDEWSEPLVFASDLERELSKAVRVYGHDTWDFENGGVPKKAGMRFWDTNSDVIVLERPIECTHSALLIGIEPIQKDTAEGLLREMVEKADKYDRRELGEDWFQRARKLLGAKP